MVAQKLPNPNPTLSTERLNPHKCPECESLDIVAGRFELERFTAFQTNCRCLTCEARWENLFIYSGFTQLRLGNGSKPETIPAEDEPQSP